MQLSSENMDWSAVETSQLVTALPTFLISQPSVAVGLILSVCLFSFAGLAVYRTYFHPLAGFPGPWLACATYLPEAYHDVWRPGMYIYEIEKMHARYGTLGSCPLAIFTCSWDLCWLIILSGPILRVNPNELSIHDPLWYDQLYVGAHVRKTNNYDAFGSNIDLDGKPLTL